MNLLNDVSVSGIEELLADMGRKTYLETCKVDCDTDELKFSVNATEEAISVELSNVTKTLTINVNIFKDKLTIVDKETELDSVLSSVEINKDMIDHYFSKVPAFKNNHLAMVHNVIFSSLLRLGFYVNERERTTPRVGFEKK